MEDVQELRTQLRALLVVRQAHMDLLDAVKGFPAEHMNTQIPGADYSFWHLLEHIRICQRDVLDYIEAEDYEWPDFPAGLWPDKASVTDAVGWQATLAQFEADRQRLVEIINDPAVDLFAPLKHSGAQRHTILREVHIIGSHNAYHTGEFAIQRGALGLW